MLAVKRITGVVGRDGGYTAKVAPDKTRVVAPDWSNTETIMPHSEAFQVVVWHLLVSHPEAES